MLRLNIDSSSEFGRASTESRVPQFQLPGRGLSLNLSASNDTSLRGSTGAGWQDKLRLSLSMDFGRNSFEVYAFFVSHLVVSIFILPSLFIFSADPTTAH
jgi:hypothetical protein